MPDDLPIYKLFRDYVKHEDSLINNRLSWLLTIHGFLYATYGFTIQKKLEIAAKLATVLSTSPPGYLKCLGSMGNLGITIIQMELFLLCIVAVGLLISLVGLLSINAARRAANSLRDIFSGQYAFAQVLPSQRPHRRLRNWLRLRRSRRPRPMRFGADSLFILSDGTRVFFAPQIGGGGQSALTGRGIIAALAIPSILMLSWFAAGSYSIFNIVHNWNYVNDFLFNGVNPCLQFENFLDWQKLTLPVLLH
ncbi:MAG TPA: hypothetical protein VMF67_01910 [Rhizomicrobium sp.]|nr:hypothetical protein [Rhizomicrobium sp.]